MWDILRHWTNWIGEANPLVALGTVWVWPSKQDWEWKYLCWEQGFALKAHLCLLVKSQQSLVTLENCPWTGINLDLVWKSASSQEDEENVDVNFDLSALILENCQLAVSQALGPCVFVWECVSLYVWVCVRELRGYIFYSFKAVFGPGLCETVSLCVFVGVTQM